MKVRLASAGHLNQNQADEQIGITPALAAAVRAAHAAGKLMRQNLRATKSVNAKTSHDIKLELDVRCQKAD